MVRALDPVLPGRRKQEYCTTEAGLLDEDILEVNHRKHVFRYAIPKQQWIPCDNILGTIRITDAHAGRQARILPFIHRRTGQLANLSLSSFKREFRRVFNDSPARYLKHKKLERARQLLEKTYRRIKEIAFECGFEDFPHFADRLPVMPVCLREHTTFRKEPALAPYKHSRRFRTRSTRSSSVDMWLLLHARMQTAVNIPWKRPPPPIGFIPNYKSMWIGLSFVIRFAIRF